jgi:hypothetical protein
MPNRAISTSPSTLDQKPYAESNRSCTDPIVGAILSGWRYDISIISPEMRIDYENHLAECSNCRRRQRIARTIDVLLISISSLSIVAFLLASVVMHRLEVLTHIAGTWALPLHLHDTPVVITLQAVAIAGLIVSMVLWVLVAVATPLPALVKSIPSDIRQRLARRHA